MKKKDIDVEILGLIKKVMCLKKNLSKVNQGVFELEQKLSELESSKKRNE